MKVKDIMYMGDRNPVVSAEDCFRDIIEVMNEKGLGAVNVVADGKLIGLVTDGDVRRLILKTQLSLPNLFLVDASKVMTKDPKSLSSEASLEEALEVLERHEFWVLPVVDEDKKLLGIVHLQALLKAMIPPDR